MPQASPLLSLENLNKSFLNHSVINGITLNISEGDIAIILGANGAGKTTLIKLAVGLSRPDKGSVKLSDGAKGVFSKNATYLGHESMLYQDLTVSENIELMLKLRKAGKDLKAALKEWEIEQYAGKKVSELSRGMRYRAALCKAFLHDPIYIFLDEPSSALDQNSLELLSAKIKVAVNKRKGFAFIVTHDIERLSQIANRFVVLDQGKVAFDSDTLKEDLMNVRNKAVDFYHRTNR
jgi:ABC-type multidrug transport system ATPase subunit